MTKEYTVLTINPGSTGTKVGLYRGDAVVFDSNVDAVPGEFEGCETFPDQVPMRKKRIYDLLAEEGIDVAEIDAVAGRGVGVHACLGGTYEINDVAYDHALNDAEGINHPATLGIVLSKQIGDELGVRSFFVNPMSIDEFSEEARMTGVKGLYRVSHGHPLNQKQVAIKHSASQGKRYEECNYVIAHLGGAVSISAHRRGRIVDSTNPGSGYGCISPNRCGDLTAMQYFELVEMGYTDERILNLMTRNGGMVDLVGTDDLRKVTGEMIPAGDELAKAAYNAMEYTMVKWIAMMAGALRGDVDAILLTGGLANDKELVARLTGDISWIAPVFVYPGSIETEALGAGAARVLAGEEEPLVYTGEPVWHGFES